MAVHTNVNNPNRSIPKPETTRGMVTKPNKNGSPVPRRDQTNDLETALVCFKTNRNYFKI
jgi:hypothetical protein